MKTRASIPQIIIIAARADRYSISKDKLADTYEINDFDEVSENDNWVKLVTKRLVDDEFVNDTFKLFNKSKVSKMNKKEPVSDR